MSPSVEGDTGIGIDSSALPMPNAVAWSRMACSPSSVASWTKAVLQERCSASRRLAVAPVPQALPLKFSRSVLVPCRVIDVRGGQLAVRGVAPTGQRGRGVDQLEGGAGRVGLLDGPVRQLRRVRLGDLRPGVLLLLRAVAGQRVRVVGRGRDHGQDLAGLRPQRHHRAGVALAPQLVVGGLLDVRVDGQHHVAAARVPAGDQVGQPAPEQPVVAAVEHGVLGPLHARRRSSPTSSSR